MAESDKLKSLFQIHNDVVETIYQRMTPVIYAIFQHILDRVSQQTDTEHSMLATLRRTLQNIESWNSVVIKSVSRPYKNLADRLEADIIKIGKYKAMIMKENGLVQHTTIDNNDIQFVHCLHVLLIESANAVEINPTSLISKNQAMFKHDLKQAKIVENAMVTILRDNLDKLEQHKNDFSGDGTEGSTLSISQPSVIPMNDSVSDHLNTVQPDISKSSVSKSVSVSVSVPRLNQSALSTKTRKLSGTGLHHGKLTPDMLKLLKKF